MKRVNKVLVVDDDITARFLVERMLRRVGVSNRVLSAANGEEALEILEKTCQTDEFPELILLDINMPLMNGFEFLEAIQQSDLALMPTKIVLLTSSTDPRDVVKAQNYPVAGYLTKPLTEANLKAIIA